MLAQGSIVLIGGFLGGGSLTSPSPSLLPPHKGARSFSANWNSLFNPKSNIGVECESRGAIRLAPRLQRSITNFPIGLKWRQPGTIGGATWRFGAGGMGDN